ncbi:MAG: FAD-binding oxidoreductase, partial [Planctomycetota bacterium]|nr:FAD-binding oxidoreductase [Planctomycetota bacterium]
REISVEGGRVRAVVTDRGTIGCRTVINAAGAHAYHVALLAGLELPIVPVRHEYLVTVECEGLHPSLPVVRIPDATLYLRAEMGALLLGGWEPRAVSVDPRKFSLERPAPDITEDWEVLAAFGKELSPLFPRVNELGIRSVFRGWPTFVPDGQFIVGESSRVRGFVLAGGCNAHGVSGSAGIGRHVVESLLDDEPSDYVKSLSPDRFAAGSWTWERAKRDAQRVYETYYAVGH